MCRALLGLLAFVALFLTGLLVPDSYGPCFFLFLCMAIAWDLL